ncbi:DUF2252 family protein, partial [Rhizobiaceae sp. 2RAB30]
ACGDCHILNFGGFATPERSIIFDINDFDETLPAFWEWDLKRLVTSVVLAARANGLSDHQGRDCAIACTRRYRDHMRIFSQMDPLHVWYAETGANEFIDSLPHKLRGAVNKRVAKNDPDINHDYNMPKYSTSEAGDAHIVDRPPLIFHAEHRKTEDPTRFDQ